MTCLRLNDSCIWRRYATVEAKVAFDCHFVLRLIRTGFTVWVLAPLIFDLEVWDVTVLRNVCSHTDYTSHYPERWQHRYLRLPEPQLLYISTKFNNKSHQPWGRLFGSILIIELWRQSTLDHFRWVWRMASSGMLLRLALVRTKVSQERSACFIRATRMSKLGTTLAVTSNRRKLRRNTNIPEDSILHSHCRENLKSFRWIVLQLFPPSIALSSASALRPSSSVCTPLCFRLGDASKFRFERLMQLANEGLIFQKLMLLACWVPCKLLWPLERINLHINWRLLKCYKGHSLIERAIKTRIKLSLSSNIFLKFSVRN
jgi:hypothetical protein